MNGILYIIATPIGNLKDISLRAIEVLKSVDYIAAEDTRHSLYLLKNYEIKTPIFSLHNYNEKKSSERVLDLLQAGKSVALISDAGTPLISDPGYILIREARVRGIKIMPIPGACALITALCASGLATDKFIFEGFLPAKSQARKARLEYLKAETRTIVFYESPHRILSSLKDMIAIFGKEREAVIARELTKQFESFLFNNLLNLYQQLENNKNNQKGEFVIILSGCANEPAGDLSPEDLRILNLLLQKLSSKDAAKLAAEITQKNKNLFYQATPKKNREY